jgi:plasmid stabilization system protein ParE
MTASLLLRSRAEQEMGQLARRDLASIIEILEFLCDNPLGAQTAGFRRDREMRRAVAGRYLIYYRYEPEENQVRVYSVRHSARRPPKLKDLLRE